MNFEGGDWFEPYDRSEEQPFRGLRSSGQGSRLRAEVAPLLGEHSSLGEAAVAGELQGFDGGASGAGGVAVRHHVDGNAGLLLALGGHGGADLCDKPILELLAGFEGASADDEGVGVEGVHHLVEEETQGVGLHAENFPAERVALLRHAAHQLGGLVQVDFGQLVAGIAWQKIRQDIFFDGGERA